MVHRLFGRQLRDRRQDAVRVRRQHHDVARHAPHIVLRRIGDEVDRIGAAAILGQAVVVQVELARDRVHHDILQHGAEPLGRREDFRFRLGRQADHLGIAAALEIEDRRVRPAMLVVADQRAAGIGRQGRLARARQAEEHRRRSVRAHIGRAVHRHDAGRRQQIVEQAEDRLLHLARIARTADQDQLLGHVDRNDRRGPAAMTRRVGTEAGRSMMV